METQRVIVTVEGGSVQDVECPPGVEVEVRDYDTEGLFEDLIKKDLDGDEYVETLYCGSLEPEGE